MGALDHQLGFFTESTFGTGGAPTRFYEYNSESIEEQEERTESDPLIKGHWTRRNDRFTPYTAGASGTISLDVLTKGFGYLFKYLLGGNATTGPTETTVYTHTGSMADLIGQSFTAQINRPFHPSGTAQQFNYNGGKPKSWTLSNAVDGNLVLEIECDFQAVETTTALATPTYPSGMEPLSWAGGTVTIGGSAYPVTEFSLKVDNNLNTDRRYISGSTLKKEPTGGRRSVEFSLKADFDTLTQRNRAHATTRSAALATVVGKWQGPTILGTTIYPNLTVTLNAARFDAWKANTENSEGAIEQELSGVALYDGTNSPVITAYQSADVTA